MPRSERPEETLIDFITGRTIPNHGAEENRQAVERLLVEVKGYNREDIEVDVEMPLEVEGEYFSSTVDLTVRVNGSRYMIIKCAAGSLSSREREVIAAARLIEDYQVPVSVASDGESAMVWDTVSGDLIGKGLDAIPSQSAAAAAFDLGRSVSLEDSRRRRQMLIYRTYATRSCAAKDSASDINK